MFNFLKKWFKPSRTDTPVEQNEIKYNNESVDGLSAERNVIATIMKRTNAPSRDAVREAIKGIPTCKRDGAKGRYYTPSRRSQAIKMCYIKFGKREKENGTR